MAMIEFGVKSDDAQNARPLYLFKVEYRTPFGNTSWFVRTINSEQAIDKILKYLKAKRVNIGNDMTFICTKQDYSEGVVFE